MKAMRDMTIKKRVLFVVMITSLLALTIVSSVTMAISFRYRRQNLMTELAILARIIGDNCLVPIAYDIPEDADKLLASLRKSPSVTHAVIHDSEGNDFASYRRNQSSVALPLHPPSGIKTESGGEIQGSYMHVWEPVLFEGKQIGVLHLFDDMRVINGALRREFIILGVLVVLVLSLAYAVTMGLDSLVSNPLSNLSDVAKAVSSAGDYTVRAKRMTGGEIGALVDSFNTMMQQIERSNATLESLVKELEGKNIELERFTYTVSHDLKSPLITIQGFVGQLRKHIQAEDEERVHRDIARVETAAGKMSDLLRDLLELSRVGHVVGDINHVKFNRLVASALSQVEGALSNSSVEVVVDDDLPSVTVDTMRFVEVMQNLLDNAIKFMGDQPSPLITIGCRKDDDQDVFFVSDNGMGIEDDYREKVFGLFEQLNQHIEGTGIGLTIVRRVIDLHGGAIWIEDGKDGQGTTFCFTISNEETINGSNDAGRAA